MIVLSERFKSVNGKYIPTEVETQQTHNCPNKQQQRSKPIRCENDCGQSIYFDPAMKSKNGIPIPLNALDGEPHNCPNKPQNKQYQQQQQPQQQQQNEQQQKASESSSVWTPKPGNQQSFNQNWGR
jgi:hypothetical protein